jgi:hypothetical protein
MLCTIGVVWGCIGHANVGPAQIRCPDSVQTKVSETKQSVKVSYREPDVTAGGNKLSELAKTTIYYDLGDGRRQAKEVPATKPAGGGQISETISVPIGTHGEQVVRICVTATDRHGNESAMVP